MAELDIIEIAELKGTGGFAPLSALVQIVPDPAVPVTRKKTDKNFHVGRRIFVNPTDFNAMKEWKPETTIKYLAMLKEVKSNE